jgi:hypothetical protein
MKKLVWIIIAVFLLSCKGNKTIENNPIYYDEFYSAINEIVTSKFSKVTLIVDETMPVYKNMFGDYPQPKATKDIPPPPPPPGIIYYDNNTFDYLVFSNQLDSSEAKFMYMSIDSMMTFRIDSSKTNFRVIPQSKIIEIFSHQTEYYSDRYEEVKKLFGSGCFIRMSTPIFNSNYTKMILSIQKYCGPPDGEDYRFILEKKNGKWKIMNDEEIWERR